MYNQSTTNNGIDKLLTQYAIDRSHVIDLLLYNPEQLMETIWTISSPLAQDNNCLCQMSDCYKSRCLPHRRCVYTCQACNNMRRIIDFRYGVLNRPFSVECGDFIGKCLMVTKSSLSNIFLTWGEDTTKKLQIITNKYHCHQVNQLLNGDPFTTKILVSYMLETHFRKINLPHIIITHTSFICHGYGYTMIDSPSIQEEMLPIRSVLLQLLVILRELSKIGFVHGQPHKKALIFAKESLSYNYENIHIEGPVTLKITDFEKSSINITPNIHLCNLKIQDSLYLDNTIAIPEIITSKERDCYFYKLTNKTVDAYNTLRNVGVNLGFNSYDCYCFMIELACQPNFRNDTLFTTLWKYMWTTNDLNKINALIDQGNSNSEQMIRGLWLRYDIVEYLWNKIN